MLVYGFDTILFYSQVIFHFWKNIFCVLTDMLCAKTESLRTRRLR